MKRKLDDNDVPSSTNKSGQENTGHQNGTKQIKAEQKEATFEDFGLDPRILKGVIGLEFNRPTAVQTQAIPVVLKGKDVLARAKTGSGKTAAYLLPILHSIVTKKKSSSERRTSALILVPTRELASQIQKVTDSLAAFCREDVKTVNLTTEVSDSVLRTLLADSPQIVITTPSRAASCINAGTLKLEALAHLVIDESDLILSYGYEDDLQVVKSSVPGGVQKILMSATLTREVETLQSLFCHDPVVLKLEETDDKEEQINQYVIRCGEEEKFLLLFVILKLKLIKGKIIIFVSDIDRCYRLKLYLEQFGIKNCVLNSELPANSRIHVVEEYNKNVYDIIIAADEHEILGDEEEELLDGDEVAVQKVSDKSPASKRRKQFKKKGKEFGISRGIDFKDVACVLNFDLPNSSKSYTHRIGRTARAGRSGTALSFIIPSSEQGKHRSLSTPATKDNEHVMTKIKKAQAKRGRELQPYSIDMGQISGFRYRVDDALRSITRHTIRDARARELRQELLKSEKLKRHFEENPDDLRHIRHDEVMQHAPGRTHSHLKHVPDYLLPRNKQKGIAATVGDPAATGAGGFASLHRQSDNRIRKARERNRTKGRTANGRKRNDPLKSFRSRK